MKNLITLVISVLLSLVCISQPVISSFSPASGPVGTLVTITGTNFSSSANSNIVFFGAVRASVSNATVSSLTVIVPLGATFQPLSITVNGLTSWSRQPFIVTFPGGHPIIQTPDGFPNSFNFPDTVTTGLHPNGIAISDFDGDGKPDFATPNNYSLQGEPASISVLRNTGTTRKIKFAGKVDLSTGKFTYAIAAGDLDGDGKPDLVSSSIQDGTISVFRNVSTQGNISFASKLDFTTGATPVSIAITDFDNDGKPDLAVSNYASNSVSVFRNTSATGNISFAAKTDFTTAFGPRFVVGGDLDGDGKSDLAVTNELSNSISVIRNTSIPGTISFAAKVDYSTDGNPFGVALGDMDADGKLDMVIANNSTYNYSIIRNASLPGQLIFEGKKNYGCSATPYNISLGDLNGDGKPDVVVACSDDVTLTQNSSTPGSISMAARTNLGYAPSVFFVAIGDLDSDGKPDLAAAMFTYSEVLLMRNKNNEPTIKSFTPASAGAGSTITISGYDFTGVTSVSFGGVAVTSFTIINSTTISAVIGSVYSGDVALTNQYGTHVKSGFVFLEPPVLTSFSPGSGAALEYISIRGKNLLTTKSVTFGNTPALYFYALDTVINAQINNGASGSISVITDYGTGSIPGFIYIPPPPPIITSFTPITAGAGHLINIKGANFSGTTAVSFGNIAAQSFNVVSATEITAVVGAGASGNISVTTKDGTGIKAGFIFIASPAITSFAPGFGQAGDTITITGSNFIEVTSIKFGGTDAASFSIISPTSIKAVLSEGSTGAISVTGLYGTGILAGFQYNYPPSIYQIDPSFGGKGQVITIYGENLSGTNKVSFGDINATSITVISPNQISAILGEGTSGAVTVATPNGSTTAGYFTYKYPPTISSFSPALGGNGAIVDITGTGFEYDPGTSVSFGGVPAASVTTISPTLIRAVAEAGASGNVSVTTNYGTAILNGFTWLPAPNVTSFTPVSVSAGAVVTISGSNFNNTTAVSFGGALASSFTVLSNTTIRAVVGLGSSGAVSVTTPGGTSSVDGFSFIPSAPPSITAFTPATGPAGTLVTVTGVNFNPDVLFNTVYFGATKAVITAASATSLTVVAPTGASYQPLTVTSNNLTAYTTRPFINTFSAGDGFKANSFLPNTDLLIGGQYYSASFVSTGDLDGDSKPDLVVVTGVGLVIYRNTSTQGNISFGSKIAIDSTSYSNRVALGDLDGDGLQDIVYTLYNGAYSDSVIVLRNTSKPGNISFSRKGFYMLKQSYGVVIRDLDGDGKPEIIASSYTDNKIAVFKNATLGGSINFEPLIEIPLNIFPYGIKAEDLDADGKAEIIVAGSALLGPSLVIVFKNTSSTNTVSFASKLEFDGGFGVTEISVGDIDGDGKTDVVTANYNGSCILRNTTFNGSISFAAKYDVLLNGTSTYENALGDMDGDGKPDLAVSGYGFIDSIAVLKNMSVPGMIAFDKKMKYATGHFPYGVNITDLDGDSRPDIILINPDDNNTIPNTMTVLRNMTGYTNICYNNGSSVISNLTGTSYQWQVNSGIGFSDISNSGNYNGTNTGSLQLTNIPNSWNGYQYRCIVNGVSSNVFNLNFTNTWLGIINNQWENPANWSCGNIPGPETDVIISKGTVIVSSNTVVRSLKLESGANVTVKPNITLTILH